MATGQSDGYDGYNSYLRFPLPRCVKLTTKVNYHNHWMGAYLQCWSWVASDGTPSHEPKLILPFRSKKDHWEFPFCAVTILEVTWMESWQQGSSRMRWVDGLLWMGKERKKSFVFLVNAQKRMISEECFNTGYMTLLMGYSLSFPQAVCPKSSWVQWSW